MNKPVTRPLVIAGPCAAESYELMRSVCAHMKQLSTDIGFDYVFKASFDKANRTSASSDRGPGVSQAVEWFGRLKKEFGVNVLTDVHESIQVAEIATVCDYLQIPAFLCRQTDLVTAAAKSGRHVNIKKGQFMAPNAMGHIYEKARAAAVSAGHKASNILLTERGVTFGYGNLVVDMRAFGIMAETGAPLILDITHSTQLPASSGSTSSGERRFAPLLARSATATGYLSGYFLEVHTNPAQAISDKDAQLSPSQAEALLRQIVPMWHAAQGYSEIDEQFKN